MLAVQVETSRLWHTIYVPTVF